MKAEIKILGPLQRRYALEQLSQIPAEPVHVIKIFPFVEKRNTDQNALFHALMRELSRRYSEHYDTFVSPQVWKEYLKQMFLGQESVTMKNGKIFTYTRHTSDLTKKEMAEFIDQCIMWSAKELEIQLTIPSDEYQ
jgi:hypothetical protein